MALQRLNLTGGSYDARSVAVAAQRALNLYGEPVPADEGEPVGFTYFLTPGLKKISSLSGTIRCLYQTTQGDLIGVAAEQVVRIYNGGETTKIGEISSGNTPVRMCDNGQCLFIVDGTSGSGWYCSMPIRAGINQSSTTTYDYTVNSAVSSGSTSLTIESAFVMEAGYTYALSGDGIADGTTVTAAAANADDHSYTDLTLSAATTAAIDAAATITIETSASTAYGTLTKLSDDAFYGSPTVDILDTFFLFVSPDTMNWYTSPAQFVDENQTPFDALYVASDAASLSTIMGLAVLGQYIWLFGRWQTELWYNSGASDFPFQRVSGVTIEVGCISPYTIAKLPSTQAFPSGAIMWLSQDRSGYARVYLGQLTAAAPVSTFPVEGALQDMGDLSRAVASVYQQEGHIFYVLTVPGQSSSWVYDASTGLWHERCSLDSNGNESQYRPFCFASAYGKVFAGDYKSGAIYEVDLDTFTDNGSPIKRQRSAPHLLTNGTRAIHRQFMLDMQNGDGQEVSVDWSDDRGRTFCAPQTLTLGSSGNVWPSIWRLGIARDRVYRVTWTDPGETALMGAFIDLEPVRS